MTNQVIHAPITASVLQLTQLMAIHQVSCIIIADEKNEEAAIDTFVEDSQELRPFNWHPVGIVTERDIVQLQALSVDLNTASAQSVMSTPLLPIHPEDPLWIAHEQMRQHHIRRLVVVDDVGKLVGIVTQTSLVQVLDPIEMCTALDALQHIVEERTIELRKANEQLENQIARERLMAAIAQRIRQSLNLETILNTTVEEVRQVLQSDRVIIYKFEPDWTGIVVVESVVAECMPILGQGILDPCFAKTYVTFYQDGRIQSIADIYHHNLVECYRDLLKKFQIRANLVVPILRGEELWGLIGVHQCSEPRQWLALEIDLLQQLATQLAIAIQQAQLYQQLEAANQELHRLATSDGLTHVANRRCFDECLEREWKRMMREHKPLSLILCDIDFFKPYNDTYGHQAGDDCLQQVANAIRMAVKRAGDLVARYGGEEFAVILPSTDTEGAMQVAQEIQLQIKTLNIAHANSAITNCVTISVGVGTTIPSKDSSPNMLIAITDKALYKAKAEGRDRIISSVEF
jgi:diguanylate cyclase (GGDEF)-like protein